MRNITVLVKKTASDEALFTYASSTSRRIHTSRGLLINGGWSLDIAGLSITGAPWGFDWEMWERLGIGEIGSYRQWLAVEDRIDPETTLPFIKPAFDAGELAELLQNC